MSEVLRLLFNKVIVPYYDMDKLIKSVTKYHSEFQPDNIAQA